MTTIAFSVSKMQPGGPLIQAGLGASISNEDLARFNHWIVQTWPEDMRVFPVTESQLTILAERSNAESSGVTPRTVLGQNIPDELAQYMAGAGYVIIQKQQPGNVTSLVAEH